MEQKSILGVDVAAETHSLSNEEFVYSTQCCPKSNWRVAQKHSARPYAGLFRLFAILAFFVSVVGVSVFNSITN